MRRRRLGLERKLRWTVVVGLIDLCLSEFIMRLGREIAIAFLGYS